MQIIYFYSLEYHRPTTCRAKRTQLMLSRG